MNTIQITYTTKQNPTPFSFSLPCDDWSPDRESAEDAVSMAEFEAGQPIFVNTIHKVTPHSRRNLAMILLP